MLRYWLAAMALASGACSAADSTGAPAEFRLAPYLWNAGFKGTMGGSDTGGRVEAEFSGLLDSIEASGLMLYADWRKGRWSVFGDWAHVKVSSSAPSPLGALFSGADGEITGNIAQGAVGYRVAGDTASSVEVFGGLRYYDLEARLALRSAAAAGRTVTGSDSWVDAVAGARWQGRFARRWVLSAYGDIAAGGSDLSWQAAATVTYEFSWGSIAGGWRHLVVDYEKDGFKIDAALSGPFIGAVFRF
jgi:hypothetical protein